MIDYLKDRHHIDIQLDKKAMEDAGIGTDTPVTEVLKGVSLRSALRLMLHKLGLTYLIQNEVLLITTPEAAESKLATRVYPVADIVGAGRDEDDNDDDRLGLARRRSSIPPSEPNTWDEVGGPGSIAHQAMGNAKVLVLSQTQGVHEEVVGLLQGLRKVKAAAAERPRRRPRSSAFPRPPRRSRISSARSARPRKSSARTRPLWTWSIT